MKIEFYGVLQEAAQTQTLELALEGQTSVADVLALLEQRLPALAPHLARTACAVGDELVLRHQQLSPDASLVLLPPVSGG